MKDGWSNASRRKNRCLNRGESRNRARDSKTFLEEGATVLALGRTPPELNNFEIGDISSLSERLKFFEVDLSDTASVKQAAKNVKALKLNITTLINNAGYIHTGMLQMTSSAEFEKQMLINFHSPMTLIKEFSKGMLKRRAGSIINISSSAAIDGNEGRSGYAASKAAIIAATKVLARESGPRNVRANCIAPGLTDTKLMRRVLRRMLLKRSRARLA